jgi:predicted cupin superfamily sugar epimerase
VLQDNQLIEHVLDTQGQSITLPSQVWFGAILKKDLANFSAEEYESTEDNIPFSLVSCTCTPAFIIQYSHNEVNETIVNVYQKASKENQSRIYLLLTPDQQSDLNQQVTFK